MHLIDTLVIADHCYSSNSLVGMALGAPIANLNLDELEA